MKKAFIGGRLRRLREERGLTQSALASALDLSPSYLNQIEKNQRPLTVPVLLRINAVFGVDVQLFSESDEARLLTELREILSDPQIGESVSANEIRDLVSNMPGIARSLATLHRRLRTESDRAEALVAHLGLRTEDGPVAQPAAYEAVRDFFYAHHNYFDALDAAAEQIFSEASLVIGETAEGLIGHLERRHGVRVAFADDGPLRSWDGASRTLTLLRRLSPSQRAFQMATQLALIALDRPIDALARTAAAGRDETHRLARIGLANYVAGALLMPYRPFLAAAERLGYDIERLSERFGVGFESVCHRLSSLQRPDARGVPFFLVRVDRAGNISKRQSATDFHFSRAGGTCPLWNVYEAFAQPGRVLVQIARMPMGGLISGSRAPSSMAGRATVLPPRPSPSASAATCAMRSGWSTPRDSTSPIRPRRRRSAPAARSASGKPACSAPSPSSEGRWRSTKPAASTRLTRHLERETPSLSSAGAGCGASAERRGLPRQRSRRLRRRNRSSRGAHRCTGSASGTAADSVDRARPRPGQGRFGS